MAKPTREEVRRLINKNMKEVSEMGYRAGFERGLGLGILIGLIVSAVIYINL